jgi:steroid 5-alpha reductase family enzyme
LFLQIQAVAAFVLVLAVRLAAIRPGSFPSFQDLVGLSLLTIAVIGESLADAQLARFRRRSSNLGGICERGLWRWSRHPNFFFEWLGWCAWPIIAIDFAGANPLSWLSLAAPLLMYILLVHISGIPPLEAHMIASRGDAYRQLQRRVNAFFPGPRHDPHLEQHSAARHRTP